MKIEMDAVKIARELDLVLQFQAGSDLEVVCEKTVQVKLNRTRELVFRLWVARILIRLLDLVLPGNVVCREIEDPCSCSCGEECCSHDG